MYTAKVQGSRYELAMENEANQWYFRLRLDGTVESEIPITAMSEQGIKESIKEAFSAVSFAINEFQLDLIQKNILGQIQHLLMASPDGKTSTTEISGDSVLGQLVNQVAKLEKTIQSIEARLERLEQLTSK